MADDPDEVDGAGGGGVDGGGGVHEEEGAEQGQHRGDADAAGDEEEGAVGV